MESEKLLFVSLLFIHLLLDLVLVCGCVAAAAMAAWGVFFFFLFGELVDCGPLKGLRSSKHKQRATHLELGFIYTRKCFFGTPVEMKRHSLKQLKTSSNGSGQ